MRRTAFAILTATLVVSFWASTGANAYNGCNKYRLGSHAWWFCVSDKDGER